MPGPPGPFGDALVAAVRDGRVSESAVDDKALRYLRLAARVGRLNGFPPVTAIELPQSDEQVAAELRSTAAAGFVLVRNEGAVLPLRREELRRVAVIGPNAEVARTLGGGSATVFPPYTISPVDGLRAALGADVEIGVAVGVTTHTRLQPAMARDMTDPASGEPGLEVRFLAADGAVLGTEHRSSGALFWTGNFGGDVPVTDVATVEVRGRLRASRTGEWTVGVQGLGAYVVSVNDEQVIDAILLPPEGTPIIEAGMHPPSVVTRLELAEGDERDITARHAVADGTSIVGLTFCVQEPQREAADDLEAAVALARDADVAIVVVGTTAEVESEGFDRDSLALPGDQDELVRRVVAANPRTIVVVNAGAPVLMPWADDVPAVLLTWFSGQEYGNALADVLLGLVEPGGRLPTTWPAVEGPLLPACTPVDGRLVYGEGLHIGYRAYEKAGVEPRYWFGHGLGYTDWEYAAFTAMGNVAEGEDLVVRAVLRNTGTRAGRDVVQVYVSRPLSSVERPVRWLGGFGSVTAAAGRDAIVDVRIPARAFQHYDPHTHSWRLEPGTFTVSAGRSVADLRAEATVAVG
jgi:beta-glucosidase